MQSILVTDADLVRARSDPVFRHQLMAENLQLLISELTKLREGTTTSKQVRQIREGGALAVQLAELLQKMDAPGRPDTTG